MANDATLICPLCFLQFPRSAAMATCPDCGSEAIEIDAVPLSQYLTDHTLNDLQTLLAKWDAAAKSFNPSYHAAKRARMVAVIEMKASS